MNERHKFLVANVKLLQAFLAFKKEETPQGEEYARRALKALKCLRAGDGKGCKLWGNLVLTK